MRLIGLELENFRCYKEPIKIRFDDLTALVGRNDVGKSSIMDALAIFFDTEDADKDDACKSGDPKKMRITCEFDSLPETLIVDAKYETSLQNEYLLSEDQTFIVRKTYNGTSAKPKATDVEAISLHPTCAGYDDLLSLKKTELASRAKDLGVDLDGVDKRANALVRAAIWQACPDLQLASVPVPLEIEGGKQVWNVLQPRLPAFALFKSDRASTDQDPEAQDPLKAAIEEAIKSVEPKLADISKYVESEVQKIADATVEKLREMDASVAETLSPVITTKPWKNLFTTSITGDEGIPLNKRGSGVKRLVLLNFFRAKAELDAHSSNSASVIYAVEEPETSQHPRNQRLLLDALRDLSADQGKQVIVTTHTPMLARYIPETDLRFIEKLDDGSRLISEGGGEASERIAKSLGVLPDHNVKLFIGVEGPHDISFLKGISSALISDGQNIPNLEKLELDGELIFFPFGGSNLALWADKLQPLRRPELHICDRDEEPPEAAKYQPHIDAVNGRDGCKGILTDKREMENYVHFEAVQEAYASNGININLQGQFDDFDDVPLVVAQAVFEATADKAWADLTDDQKDKKSRRAKHMINNSAVGNMSAQRLGVADPAGEILGWLQDVADMMSEVD